VKQLILIALSNISFWLYCEYTQIDTRTSLESPFGLYDGDEQQLDEVATRLTQVIASSKELLSEYFSVTSTYQ
jgi:hypothetical protein